MSVFKLFERVFIVGRGGWGGLPSLSAGQSCNVFLLDGGEELALVDAGVPESVDDVLSNIASLSFDPSKVRKLLLTHSHWDHSAALADWERRLALTAFGHSLAKETMEGGPGIYDPDYRPSGHVKATVHQPVHEGDLVEVGDLSVRVLAAPGHTPDSLAFQTETAKNRVLFSGDTAIGDQPSGEGIIGWIDGHWHSNLTDYHRSLLRLREADADFMFPGHGISSDGQQQVTRSLNHCLERLERLGSIPQLSSMMPVG